MQRHENKLNEMMKRFNIFVELQNLVLKIHAEEIRNIVIFGDK